MYTFVFLWTPALSPKGEKIPHGLIFAAFMTSSMAGSSLAGLLMKRAKVGLASTSLRVMQPRVGALHVLLVELADQQFHWHMLVECPTPGPVCR